MIDVQSKLQSIDLNDKIALLSVDWNVPIKDGKVLDAWRIAQTLPTIELLQKKRAKIVVLTHLGRPEGKRVRALSTIHLVKTLKKLGLSTRYIENPLREGVRAIIETTNADLALIENLRFWKEEEGNDAQFARRLCELGEVVVMDAFANLHRAHASTVGITRYLPSCPGMLVEEELRHFGKLVRRPLRPLHLILGGAKADEKLPVIANLAAHADKIIVGGVVANTFLKANGVAVRDSMLAEHALPAARQILRRFSNKIILPLDYAWRAGAIMDLGPRSVEALTEQLREAQTIFWNGPLGFSQDPRFARASYALARLMAAKARATTIAAGGETLGVINHLELGKRFSFLSTGGGATLQYLSGKALPGLVALGLH